MLDAHSASIKIMPNKKAFTLLELVIVMVLISIITSIAIPSYTKSVNKQRCRNNTIALTALHGLLIMHFANNNSFPVTPSTNPLLTSLNTTLRSNLKIDGTFSYTRNSTTSYTASATSTQCTLTLNNQTPTTSGEPACAGTACPL